MILNLSWDGISFLHLLGRTPVAQRASKARIVFPSGTNQLFSMASAKSITERVRAGAIAGFRKPSPVFAAGPLGMCEGLGWWLRRWTDVLPSNQI